jgi:hypothetical protein
MESEGLDMLDRENPTLRALHDTNTGYGHKRGRRFA